MRRFRLAALTLTSSLLVTLSGCASFCDDSWSFPRLFHSSRVYNGVDCDCHHAPWTPGVAVPPGQGPFVAPPPGAMPAPPPGPAAPPLPPVTNVPANAPPHLFKVPQAAPVPYSPAS